MSIRNIGLALPAILFGSPFVYFAFHGLYETSSTMRRSIGIVLAIVVSPMFIGCLLRNSGGIESPEHYLDILLLDTEQVFYFAI